MAEEGVRIRVGWSEADRLAIFCLRVVRPVIRSNKPYATTISIRSVFPKSMRPPKPNSIEPPSLSELRQG